MEVGDRKILTGRSGSLTPRTGWNRVCSWFVKFAGIDRSGIDGAQFLNNSLIISTCGRFSCLVYGCLRYNSKCIITQISLNNWLIRYRLYDKEQCNKLKPRLQGSLASKKPKPKPSSHLNHEPAASLRTRFLKKIKGVKPGAWGRRMSERSESTRHLPPIRQRSIRLCLDFLHYWSLLNIFFSWAPCLLLLFFYFVINITVTCFYFLVFWDFYRLSSFYFRKILVNNIFHNHSYNLVFKS